ncbi:hypothetical protein NUU61_006191 [Penicillium alfredii]|uniref:Uncharacterized protein n=1 Tax=Penicillium alfredii TaxID=1506179 RepID=A0A9W9K3I2_9EURO|nr:uncharacterized protein NUU61_006191 [Penicillium alfredii]KAJ5091321.1 hypothetical protein NUU61_006191 [Penicillium alfredii]
MNQLMRQGCTNRLRYKINTLAPEIVHVQLAECRLLVDADVRPIAEHDDRAVVGGIRQGLDDIAGPLVGPRCRVELDARIPALLVAPDGVGDAVELAVAADDGDLVWGFGVLLTGNVLVRRCAVVLEKVVEDAASALVLAGFIHGRFPVAHLVQVLPRRTGRACEAGPVEDCPGFFHGLVDLSSIVVAVAALVDAVSQSLRGHSEEERAGENLHGSAIGWVQRHSERVQ